MKFATNIVKILAVVSVAGAAASAHAISNQQFFLVNETDRPIIEFYATHVGDSMSPDLLGIQTLRAGYNVLIDAYDGFPGDCLFNFKTVMDDGEVVYKRNVNVCAILSYTITP